MKEILSDAVFFGVVLTLLSYEIGVVIKKKFDIAIFNPLIISVVIIIILLLVLDVDYKDYEEGSRYITYLLTPATVCLAVPLYEQLALLKKNFKAVILGILSGVLTSGLSIFVFALIFNFSHKDYVSIFPKSITTAIGLALSDEMGGVVAITVSSIVITGTFGNIIADFIFKIFKIKEPVAKGVALGTSAHVMGTSKAIEIGETEGAISGLSIAVAGIMTVILASVFVELI
jgi:predicted murein hydrolase (TIGR00659 family)